MNDPAGTATISPTDRSRAEFRVPGAPLVESIAPVSTEDAPSKTGYMFFTNFATFYNS
jgi:hypothetical protein